MIRLPRNPVAAAARQGMFVAFFAALGVFLGGCPTDPGAADGANVPYRSVDPLAAEPAEPPVPRDPVAEAAARATAERLARENAAREEVAARLRAEADAAARSEAERLAFEAKYPLHGVAFQFLVPIRREPSDRAATVGYVRRGAQFRASARVEGRGCARGFHEIPGEGFVCRGDGVTIGESLQTFEPSPNPPSLEDALPYAYAFTPRTSAPQYFRIPTPAEESQIGSVFARMDALVALGSATAAADGGVPAAAESAAVEAPPPPGTAAATAAAAETPAEDDGLPDYLRMRMRRGFYVSVDGTESAEDGRDFIRTVRGAYVPEAMLTPNEPPTHRGVVLGGTWTLPIGFVYRVGAHRLTRDAVSGELADLGAVDQHTSFVVRDRFTRGPTAYLVTDEGWAVRENAARVARQATRPAEVPEGARWLHIDLSDQILVAYEGERAVFTTTVSTGREGFATPTGVFRIQSKHVSTTMDDLAAGDEAYSIEDVPWTMYFQGNYALHGAFWHNQFGRVRSHGCVNLAPADARWIFGWATPTLPASWHGVFARPSNPGTYVVVVP